MFEIRICLIPWITQAHLSQIQLPGLVLEFSGRVDFETIPAYIYKDDLTLDMEVVEDKGGVDEGIDRIELYF